MAVFLILGLFGVAKASDGLVLAHAPGHNSYRVAYRQWTVNVDPGCQEIGTMDFRNLTPGDHWFAVAVGKDCRPFRVHVPPAVDRRSLPVLAFDGVTLFNREGNMGAVNGLDDASDRYGSVAIYPVPKTRYLGILAGWNAEGGFLAYRNSYDDIEYIHKICNLLRIQMFYAVGFSAGAQFAHVLAGRLPGMVAGVVSVSGTWLGTEPTPPPGTAALIIHGEDDRVLPYRGGTSSLKTRVLIWLGNRNVRSSRPDLQAVAYAAANHYQGDPAVLEGAFYVKRSFQGPSGVPVEEYRMRWPFGGHTYHGRKTGKGTESLLSRRNGRPLPADVFSVNDVMAAFLGFGRP
jgi:poly(3-hydroxybutyrate) depolymerase